MENRKTVTHTAGEALPAGTILLGRYRIDRLLGQGGFGITYVAQDLQLQRPVAVKELLCIQGPEPAHGLYLPRERGKHRPPAHALRAGGTDPDEAPGTGRPRMGFPPVQRK